MYRIYFEYWPRKGEGHEEVISCAIKQGESVVQEIFVQEHSIFELMKWLTENWQAILNEQPPDFLPEANSLRDADYACRDNWPDDWEDGSELDKLIDEQYDILYWYAQRHCLDAGFQGTDVPVVYIGLHKGVLTVSWRVDNISHCYEIEPKVEIRNKQDGTVTFV